MPSVLKSIFIFRTLTPSGQIANSDSECDFAELTGSGHILGSNSENSNLLPVAVE